MPITREVIQAAIKNSGGVERAAEEVDALAVKLQALEDTGRYGKLLNAITQSNNKSNFLAAVLEATFAHQFESKGLALDHEVRQSPTQGSSIDFALTIPPERVFMELRLLQQDAAVTASITEQLAQTGTSATCHDGQKEQEEIFRVQGTALSKAQDRDGNPTKFFKVDNTTVNIVVVAISGILLGMADRFDCLLAACGDPAVPDHARRDVFGIFQDLEAHHPEPIRKMADRFERFKATIHGILFLFRAADVEVCNYTLQQVLVWNKALITPERAKPVAEKILEAIPALKQG